MLLSPSIVLHTDNPGPALAVLADAHPDLPVTPCDNHAGLVAAIAQAQAEIVYSVRFGARPKFPRKVLVENPLVKWLAVGGSGIDHLGPWNPITVTVTNTAGAGADMMAEYVLGAMLSFSLGLRGFFRQQQARTWIAGKVEPIEGATLLILGLGHTGRAVARRAKAMGMVALGVRARPRPTAHVDEVHGVDALPGLWGRADFIVCSVPLLAETRGLVGADAFAAMKPERRADRRLARRRGRRGGAHRRPRWQPAQGCRTGCVYDRAAARRPSAVGLRQRHHHAALLVGL